MSTTHVILILVTDRLTDISFHYSSFCLYIPASHTALAFYFANAMEDLGASTTSSQSDDTSFMDTIRRLAYSMMVLGAIMLISMTTQAALIETAATEMTMTLKTDWFQALLRQDMAYYDIMDVPGQATIISVNANKYRKGVGRKLAQAVQFFVTFCGGIGYAFWSSWIVSLAVLAIAPFITLTAIFLVKVNSSVTARANTSYAKAGSIVSTCVSSIRTILALNAVEIMIGRFQEATKEAYDGAVSHVHWLGLANGSNVAAMLLAYVVVTLLGAFLLYDQVMENGCDPSGTVEGNDNTCDPAGGE
jgi:ATP-binding cassette subfamily B (MDR/TAP) protein 1